jgi:lipid A 3-O-deacylase
MRHRAAGSANPKMDLDSRTFRTRHNRLAAALIAFAAVPALAEESFASVTFQDDIFFGRDGGGYTSGFFVSKVRVASPGESGVEPPWLLRPVVAWFGMPQATLASSSLGQIIVTPRDISKPVPDLTDAPYLGALVFRSAHVYVHDGVADMLALNLGVIGPASGAAQTQRFFHRLTGSTRPEGWDNQVPNRGLLGVERYRAWRFPWHVTQGGSTSGDLIVLGGGVLGNLESSLGGTVLLRYGTGLEPSFPTAARVTAGTGDPFAIGRGWFAYAGFSGDRIFSHAGIGSDAPPGNIARLRESQYVSVAGIAYGWSHSSLSFSLQSANPLVKSSNERQSYGSITYIWRMR